MGCSASITAKGQQAGQPPGKGGVLQVQPSEFVKASVSAVRAAELAPRSKSEFIRNWVDATPAEPSAHALSHTSVRSRLSVSRGTTHPRSAASSRAASRGGSHGASLKSVEQPSSMTVAVCFEPRVPRDLGDPAYASLVHHCSLREHYDVDVMQEDRGAEGVFTLVSSKRSPPSPGGGPGPGGGGPRQVYQCRSLSKTLLTQSPEEMNLLQAEVEVMHALTGCSGTVQLHAVYEDATAYHLVLDRCAGGDLFDLIMAVGRLPERLCAVIISQVITTVGRLHREYGVLHRDVCLENIYLDRVGQAGHQTNTGGTTPGGAAVPAGGGGGGGGGGQPVAEQRHPLPAHTTPTTPPAAHPPPHHHGATLPPPLSPPPPPPPPAASSLSLGRGVGAEESSGAVSSELSGPLTGQLEGPGAVGAAYRVKLGGFASAAFYVPGQRFGDIVGSNYYLAPEVLRRNHSWQADVWSIGVVLYMMLVGQPPFNGETEMEIFTNVMSGSPDFSADVWSGISPEAIALTQSMINFEPLLRPTLEKLAEHPWLTRMMGGGTGGC